LEKVLEMIAMKKKTLIYLFLLMLWLLAACANTGPATKVNFTITDFAFTPNEFTVPAGQEITINVTHNGSMQHNFIVMKFGTNAGEMFDEGDRDNVLWEVTLQPGDVQTVLFNAPEQPGTYQILCGMPGHMQSGMLGKLIVTEPSPTD
jgi:uncharacterized cupredoxin-like copper-binding protein